MKIDRKALKADAKSLLGGSITSPNWWKSTFGFFAIDLVQPLSIFISNPIQYGKYQILNNLRETEKFSIKSHIFKGFKENYADLLVLNIVETLFLMLWSMLLFIPAIIKSYAYSMSTYFLFKKPEQDFYDAHTLSVLSTKGFKWKLFVLDLSFIGWYIVGSLCLGIGVLFVRPYHYLTKYLFFEKVFKKQFENKDTNDKYEAMEQLYKDGTISKEEFDTIVNNLDKKEEPAQVSEPVENNNKPEVSSYAKPQPKVKSRVYRTTIFSELSVDEYILFGLLPAFLVSFIYFFSNSIDSSCES